MHVSGQLDSKRTNLRLGPYQLDDDLLGHAQPSVFYCENYLCPNLPNLFF